MTDIIPVQFGTTAIRIMLDAHGEPWWFLSECCQAVGLPNATRVAERLDPDDLKKTQGTDRLGRPQEVWMVNESGLYTLLLRSNKPEAKRFRRWVTQEVLPTIRKTGTYDLPRKSSGDMLVEMALAYRGRFVRLQDRRPFQAFGRQQ